MFNYVGKRKVSEDQHDSLTSSKRFKMSTGTDVITDASAAHQTLSSHDSGMYTSVIMLVINCSCCHGCQNVLSQGLIEFKTLATWDTCPCNTAPLKFMKNAFVTQ